jgi:hypothetical protein
METNELKQNIMQIIMNAGTGGLESGEVTQKDFNIMLKRVNKTLLSERRNIKNVIKKEINMN